MRRCFAAVPLLVLVISGLAYGQSPNTYTYHQCNCGVQPCPTVSNVASGQCQNTVPFVYDNVLSSTATCQDAVQQCANIAFFSDANCTTFEDFISPVCNTCAKIANQAKTSGASPYKWIRVDCDAVTQVVTVHTNCNAGCTNCTATVESHPFESCVSSVARSDRYIVNQGIQPCTAIRMQEWFSSASCGGAPDVDRLVSQSYCDQGNLYMCATQPKLTTPAGNVVLTSTCADGCSYDCQYDTALSGACEAFSGPFGTFYRTDACNVGITSCVNMLLFQDNACSQFGAAFQVTCGTCSENGFGDQTHYLYANCLDNSSVIIYDCPDATCTLSGCTARPIRNQFQCAIDTQPGTDAKGNNHFPGFQSAMNFGVVECSTITENWYTTADCTGTPQNSITLGTGECSGHGRAICGNFALRSVQIAQCGCVASVSKPCALQTVASSSCQTVTNFSTGAVIPGFSRQIDCQSTTGTCVRAGVFADAGCTNFIQIAAPVCGQCDQSLHFGYMKVNCDASMQTTSFSLNCNADCSVCAETGVDSAAIGTCHPTLSGRFFFKAMGLQQCDVVRMTVWNTSTSCAGKAMASFYRQAGQCAYGESITCAQPPTLPGKSTLPPTGTGREVLHTSCTTDKCGGTCQVTNRESGTCYPVIGIENLSPVASLTVTRRLTCRGDRYCSDLVSFTGTSCTGANFRDVMPAVCGACQLFNTSSNLFQRLNCDPISQNVWWDLDCDATCMNCQRPGQYVRLLDQCDTAISPGIMILNTGVYPCTGIQVEDFNGLGCGATGLVRNMTLPQGQCVFGESFVCGSFDVPNVHQANVTARTCNCQGANCPQTGLATNFATNVCQTLTTAQYGVLSTTVQCPVDSMTCASFATFNSTATCDNFVNVMNIVCNVCQQFAPGQYVFYDCDSVNMKVRTYVNCNADCTQCTDPSATVVSFLAVCSTAPEIGATKKLLTIRPCDALIKLDFANGQCQGQPLFAGAIAQDQCAYSDYEFACSNAPSIAGYGPGAQVLQTVCQDKWCAQNCIATVFQSGECTATVGGGSQMLACSAVTGSVCVDFSIHNGTTCNRTSFTPRSALCGTCVQDPTNGGYFSIGPCSNDATFITVSTGCNANCNVCTGPQNTINIGQCTATNGQWALRPYNVYPCTGIQVTKWAGRGCTGTPTFSALVADGDCGINGRLQCGYNISTDVVTNPNLNQVGYFDCGCNTGISGCGHSTFAPNSCQTTLQPNYAATKVRCSNTLGQCARLTLFSEAGCGAFLASYNFLCGSCATFSNTNYKVTCNGPIVSLASCADAKCGTCNASQTMPLDRCTSVLNTGTWGRALGVAECETAVVEQWFTSTSCAGNPDNVEEVAQGDCSDHAVFQCTKQVLFSNQTTNGDVLITTCAYGSYCTKDCLYQSAAQGQCIVTEFGGMTTTCLSAAGTCATFGVFKDNQCAENMNIISIACNTCQYFPNLGYYSYLRCDSVTNNVAFSTGCSSDCSYCANSDVDIRPQYICAQAMQGANAMVGELPYLVNFGVHQCDQVKSTFYTSERCDPSTMNGAVVNQASSCDGHTTISCGNYQLQSLSMQMCGVACNGNCPPQTLASSGQCVTLPMNRGSAIASCGSAQANCANLVIYRGAGCTNADYTTRANPVCGGCLYSEDLGVWFQANCDLSTQTVSLLKCGKNCVASTCSAVQDVHPYNNCSAAATGGNSVFNLGIFTCDQVSVAYYNSTDCSGAVSHYVNQAQGECAWGLSVLCSQPPYQSQNSSVASTEVLLQSCPPASQIGPYCASSECTTTVYQDGTCFAGNFLQHSRFPANSTQFICRNGRQCGSLLAFPTGDTTCDGNAENIFTIVCDTCAYFNGSYHRSVCDVNTRTMILFDGCDSQCQNCASTPLVRPEGTCVLGNDGQKYISLRSLFPCTAVEVHTYAANDCDPTAVLVNMTQSAGHCEFGHTFHCGQFNLPPSSVNQATVTQTDCACSGANGACAPTLTYLEDTCQLQNAALTTYQGSYSATCNPKMATCAQLHFFGSAVCDPKSWVGVNYVACGTCMKFENNYARVVCDDSTQTVTVDSMCDATCSQCSFLSAPHVYQLNDCQPSLRPEHYLVLQGIAPCNSVDVIAYPDSQTCGETPAYVQTLAQSMCTPMGSLQCSNAPAWPTNQRFTQVLESFCPGDFGCNTGCTSTILQSGSCVEFTPDRFGHGAGEKVYTQVKCNSQPETCVTVVGFNGSSTCEQSSFMMINSYVCGSCTWNDRFNLHLSVQCGTNSVTFLNCTDTTCGTCTQTMITLKPQQCTYDAFDSGSNYFHDHPAQVYLIYHAMTPCNTVTFDLYADSACATAPRASIKHEAGMCDGIVRYQCGNDFSQAVIPTPPPQLAGVGTFVMKVNGRFNEQTFAAAVLQYVGAPITDVYLSVSFEARDITFYFTGANAVKYQQALAQSISNNATFTAILFGASSLNFVAQGSPLPTSPPFPTSNPNPSSPPGPTITNTPLPPPPPPGPPGSTTTTSPRTLAPGSTGTQGPAAPSRPDDSDDTGKTAGIAIGVIVAVVASGAIAFLIVRRVRGAPSGSGAGSIRREHLDEADQYEMYQDRK